MSCKIKNIDGYLAVKQIMSRYSMPYSSVIYKISKNRTKLNILIEGGVHYYFNNEILQNIFSEKSKSDKYEIIKTKKWCDKTPRECCDCIESGILIKDTYCNKYRRKCKYSKHC